MGYCKLQIGCMLIILYIVFVYVKECMRFRQKHRFSVYDMLLAVSIVSVLFDGLTAYTVNHQEKVSEGLNRILHLVFLLSLDMFIFFVFIYMISITVGLPKSKKRLLLLYTPIICNVLLVILYIPELKYIEGEITNYSIGVSAYTCFGMIAVYILFSMVIFLKHWRYIEKYKRISSFTYLFVLACIAAYQMLHPQALISCLCVTIIVVGAFINQENPTVKELAHYHNEMIMGFATLVENKDGSTGGHIKRTTMYVKLLAEELRRQGYYSDILTKDYTDNLYMAAPMHDIGKISVPDVILQKPGKLTDEEFEKIKQHSVNGGKIVKQTFSHLGKADYVKMAYEVARFHHEKWNGKGYPDGLKEEEIPLSARIMAIADVFDAVSEKRCYREAMPLEQCFEIIQMGRGTDFDPLLVDAFLNIKDQVKQVHELDERTKKEQLLKISKEAS